MNNLHPDIVALNDRVKRLEAENERLRQAIITDAFKALRARAPSTAMEILRDEVEREECQ